VIDTRSFENGTLVVELVMNPDGACAASMDLFDAEARLPASPEEQEKIRGSQHRLEFQYGTQGIKPGETATLVYPFDHGQIFQLGVTGDWFSPSGALTDYQLKVSVE
jgi:hypothetical protein